MKESVPSVQAARPEQGLRAAVLQVNVRHSEDQNLMETTARAASTIIKKAVLAGREKVSGRNARSVPVPRGRVGRRDLSGKMPGRDSRLKRVRRSRRTGAGQPENRF